jgi:hypothetical protein
LERALHRQEHLAAIELAVTGGHIDATG